MGNNSYKTLIYLFLFSYFQYSIVNSRTVPVIHNAALVVLGKIPTRINSTCQQCICKMLFQQLNNITAINCIPSQLICEIFVDSLETNSFVFKSNSSSTIYLISIPTTNPILPV